MNQLLRFHTADGQPVCVEVELEETGLQRASPVGDRIVDMHRRFGEALTQVRDAAAEALATFRDPRLNPDVVEIEFGVRLTVEAGAVIARTAGEGNLTLRLKWNNS
jgi:hypothetical protein